MTLLRNLIIAMAALGAACATTSGVRVGGTPESHREAALQLIEVLNLKTAVDSMADVALQAQLKGNPSLEPFRQVLIDFMHKYQSWDRLSPEFVQIYMDAYSEKEMREISAFYQTETGKKSVRLMPELIQKGKAVGERIVQEHMDELKARLMERAQELKH
jgi:hypothetical protein